MPARMEETGRTNKKADGMEGKTRQKHGKGKSQRMGKGRGRWVWVWVWVLVYLCRYYYAVFLCDWRRCNHDFLGIGIGVRFVLAK